MTEVYGIIGDPVTHSLSPVMHNAAFDHLEMDSRYLPFRVSSKDLKIAIEGAKALGVKGLNVTIPHKEACVTYLELDKEAALIGAVNTISFKEGMKGYNTDGIGAVKALEVNGIDIEGTKFLIVGAGGSARAIAFSVGVRGGKIVITNRTSDRGVKLARDLRSITDAIFIPFENINEVTGKIDVLINTTPVGMYPEVDSMPISSEFLTSDLVVFDIVYNPLKTRLIREAERVRCKTILGVDMLVFQGAESFKIWTGMKAPIDVMKDAVLQVLRD